jgi:hypothetical protein
MPEWIPKKQILRWSIAGIKLLTGKRREFNWETSLVLLVFGKPLTKLKDKNCLKYYEKNIYLQFVIKKYN